MRRWVLVGLVCVACAEASARTPVVAEVDRELAGAAGTHYEFGDSGGDDDGGIDCSGYVNRVLRSAAPRALASLRELRHRPRAREYVAIAQRGGDGWLTVARVADLRAGDVLAWRHGAWHVNPKDPKSTGHVGIVVAPPRAVGDKLWEVKISDAARSGHSDDSRAPGVSGVGAGWILVATDERGAPTAIAWSRRGRFEVPDGIGMGRPQ